MKDEEFNPEWLLIYGFALGGFLAGAVRYGVPHLVWWAKSKAR